MGSNTKQNHEQMKDRGPEAQLTPGRFCPEIDHHLTGSSANAVGWFHRAAKQGLAAAQIGLALCYIEGRGTAQDYTKAAYRLRPAGNQGSTPALFILGLLSVMTEELCHDMPAA